MALTGMTASAYDSNSYEPQRQNHILLYIVGVTDFEAEEDVLVLAEESFPLPKQNNNPIEVAHLNEKRKFAGNPVFEDLQVVFKDFCSHTVADRIRAWREDVYNPATGVIGLASEYKKNGRAVKYNPKGLFVEQWNIQGIWPSAFDPGDADQTGDDMVRINVTLTIDKAVYSNADAAPAAWPTQV